MIQTNSIEFEIQGHVQAWQRRTVDPRSGRSFVPEKTKDYKDFVKLSFRQAQINNSGVWPVPTYSPVSAKIVVNILPSKSDAKWLKEAKAAGEIAVTKKPDCDNIAKGILDALNKMAYDDDAQIFKLEVEKVYGQREFVSVELTEWRQPNSNKDWKDWLQYRFDK